MTDKEKLMENWDDLEDETKTKILELANKEIKEDYFVPKEGETYFMYVYNCCKISFLSFNFKNSSLDKYNIEIGNVFRTPEEAVFAGNCDYYTKVFETYVNRHTKKLDWSNDEQTKFYAYYEFKKADIYYHFANRCKQQGTIYASSVLILKDAIADIGEENFLKYVMKVEK